MQESGLRRTALCRSDVAAGRMMGAGRFAAAAAASIFCVACSAAPGSAGAPAVSQIRPAKHLAPTPAPSLLWQGARRINILCQVSSETGNDPALEASVCERVRAISGSNAPLPVAVAAAPDAQALAADTVVLLVQASARNIAGQNILAFTIRPFRSSAGDAAALFGTVPRVEPLNKGGVGDNSLNRALQAALAEILPWVSSGSPSG